MELYRIDYDYKERRAKVTAVEVTKETDTHYYFTWNGPSLLGKCFVDTENAGWHTTPERALQEERRGLEGHIESLQREIGRLSHKVEMLDATAGEVG